MSIHIKCVFFFMYENSTKKDVYKIMGTNGYFVDILRNHSIFKPVFVTVYY